jgi:glycosyltransferase involved in cell wall biosynthesis
MAPLASVIIPTYNRATLVAEALASVQAQTFRDFEIVVVDDGGTDGTVAALAGWPEVRVLRHPRRRGVSAARNTGIHAARGQWLAFLDSDDLWLPDKLARQMDYLTTRPGLYLGQTDETWVRRGVRVNKPLSHRKVAGGIFLPSLRRCMISPSAAVVHRRLFQDHGAFDETLAAAEDYDLWLRLTWRYEVGLVEAPLVIKRGGHLDQLSGQWGLDRFRIRALIKLLADPDLPEPYARAARCTLAAKSAIYAQGCDKRGRQSEAAWYRALSRRAQGPYPGRAGAAVLKTFSEFGGTGVPPVHDEGAQCAPYTAYIDVINQEME